MPVIVTPAGCCVCYSDPRYLRHRGRRAAAPLQEAVSDPGSGAALLAAQAGRPGNRRPQGYLSGAAGTQGGSHSPCGKPWASFSTDVLSVSCCGSNVPAADDLLTS